MSSTNHNDSSKLPEDSVSRREFLVRLGVTGALIAGSGLAARKLWQPKHFVPGFEKEIGLQLRSYAPEVSKVLPSLAIAHGTEHEKTIRAAMAAAADRPKLDGTIEVDETFIGGKQRGHQHKAGHPECKKQVVIGIRQRGGALRFFHAEDVKSGTLAKYIKENIAHDVDVIMTDEFGGYPSALAKAGVLAEHKTVKHKDGIYVDGDVYTNGIESAFSLLKRGIVGTWHRISAKHLQAYLNEMCFRFDNRKNPFLFRDTLLRLLQTEHLEYKELTAAA